MRTTAFVSFLVVCAVGAAKKELPWGPDSIVAINYGSPEPGESALANRGPTQQLFLSFDDKGMSELTRFDTMHTPGSHFFQSLLFGDTPSTWSTTVVDQDFVRVYRLPDQGSELVCRKARRHEGAWPSNPEHLKGGTPKQFGGHTYIVFPQPWVEFLSESFDLLYDPETWKLVAYSTANTVFAPISLITRPVKGFNASVFDPHPGVACQEVPAPGKTDTITKLQQENRGGHSMSFDFETAEERGDPFHWEPYAGPTTAFSLPIRLFTRYVAYKLSVCVNLGTNYALMYMWRVPFVGPALERLAELVLRPLYILYDEYFHAPIRAFVVWLSGEQNVIPAHVYNHLSGEEKIKMLWERIERSHIGKFEPDPRKWDSKHAASVSMRDPFIERDTQDLVSIGGPCPFMPQRSKDVHAVGSIAKVEVTFYKNSNYTGMFEPGVYKNVLLRVSVPVLPIFTGKPGFALKFMRENGRHSANIFGLKNAFEVGYNSSNFFDYVISSHSSRPQLVKECHYTEHLLAIQIQREVSDFPGILGNSDMSQYKLSGEKVDKPHFPFVLLLVPTPKAREMFSKIPANIAADPSVAFPQVFKGNEKLWDILAADTDQLERIGELRLQSPFRSSTFDQRHLFFRHQKFEEDLALRPEFKDLITPHYLSNTWPIWDARYKAWLLQQGDASGADAEKKTQKST